MNGFWFRRIYLGDFYDALDKGKRFNTLQVFSGFKNEKIRIGLLFANQKREPEDYGIGSGYSVFNMNEKLSFLLRYDKMLKKNPQGDKIPYTPFSKDAPSNLVITGFDFKPHKDVHFMPNLKYVFYEKENGKKPGEDMYFNLTFIITLSKFKRGEFESLPPLSSLIIFPLSIPLNIPISHKLFFHLD